MRTVVPLAGMAAVLLYLGAVVLQRRSDTARMEAARVARLTAREAASRYIVQEPGTAVRISHFYGSSGEITRGEQAVVCYGVQNATAVRIEPAVEDLKPAWNRCFAVSPRATTTYTLRALGADGTESAASFRINVGPPPPRILFISLSQTQLPRGTPLTMCYGVVDTVRAWLEPARTPLTVSPKFCMRWFPLRTTTYTFVASGEDGRTDRERFAITVR